MAVTFDTLAFAERLRRGGFSEEQAKAATEAFATATAQELVTTSDLELLRKDLEKNIESVRQDLTNEITLLDQRVNARFEILEQRMDARFAAVDRRFEGLEQRLTIKMGGMLAAAVALMAAVVKLL